MRTFFGILSVAIALFTAVVAADLSGMWTLSWEPDFGGNFDAYDCTFKQEGRGVTVRCLEDMPFPVEMTGELTGEMDRQQVILRFKAGRDGSENGTLTGDLDQRGTTITGTWHLVEQKRDGKFSARKH